MRGKPLALLLVLAGLIILGIATGNIEGWWNGTQSLYHGQVMWNGNGMCNHMPSWLASCPGPGPVNP